ncbi:MAG: DUF421 domain-containing protein [Bacillota bacterium]|nr:DUF421 domain-containing protein [Bacillota bacterium]
MSEIIWDFGDITLRSLFSIITLFFLAKLIGPRQIAQLTFYDYVIGISVGSIAAAIAIDQDLSLWLGLWSMAVYIGVSYFMAISGNKSIKARRFFSGTPKVLLYQGKIIEKNLKSQKMDLNDFLAACRVNGYFDLNELEYAIMENNGNISFMPKSPKAPLTPEDMEIFAEPAQLTANVIIDGNIMERHLASIGKNEEWLKAQLLSNGGYEIRDILLATANERGDFHIYLKNQNKDALDLFN